MNVLNLLKYSPQFGGGIASHLSSLGRKLTNEGHKLFLGFPEKREWQNELSNSSEIIIIPEINSANYYSFPKTIEYTCRKEAIDIIHIHFSFAMIFSLSPVRFMWTDVPRGTFETQLKA